MIVRDGGYLRWSFLGLTQKIPFGVIADAFRVIEDYCALVKIGRSTEVRIPTAFVWQQTVPLGPDE